MGTIKIRCIKQYESLKGLLDLDDEIEIITKVSTENKKHQVKIKNPKGEGTLIVNEVLIPNGNYEGYTFLSKNGNTYSDHTLYCHIGYFKMGELFQKI